MIKYLLLAAALVAADAGIKYWAVTVLKPMSTIVLIPGVFSFQYHENFGAAWGIFQGQRVLLLVVTGIVLTAMTVGLVMNKFPGSLLSFSVALIIGGGFGNFFDRLLREGGYVVDFLYFELINFPIFNFADSCVVVGVSLFAIYILFLEGKEKRALPDA